MRIETAGAFAFDTPHPGSHPAFGSDDRWQTPEDQPDIHPGKKHLIK
jgi:hypothetical protein